MHGHAQGSAYGTAASPDELVALPFHLRESPPSRLRPTTASRDSGTPVAVFHLEAAAAARSGSADRCPWEAEQRNRHEQTRIGSCGYPKIRRTQSVPGGHRIDGCETIVRESDGLHLNAAGAREAADGVLAAIDRDFTR